MALIAVGGFQHETNTFAAVPAQLIDFLEADAWPGLSRGAALEPAVAGINLPIAGFITEARALGHRILPLTWCSAGPSAAVTTEAFERIAQMLLEDLGRAEGLDALYLDLHGAMVTEHHEDGEGELLARIRRHLGERIPIVASLDLHANVTRQMTRQATALTAYRSYPHTDMAATGARAARLLDGILGAGAAPSKAFRRADFLLPLVSQCTLEDPARRLYALLAEIEAAQEVALSFAMGFPAADIADCGPTVFGYGAVAEGAVTRLADALAEAEPDFTMNLLPADEAVTRALAFSRKDRRPVLLADTQDNPGGGAESDGVELLAALLRADADGAVLGLVKDPVAAEIAHRAGLGPTLEIGIGAGSGYGGAKPLRASWTVEALGDGRILGTGPFYGGTRMALGPMACLSCRGVRVLVASRKQQAADQAMFRHLGIEPIDQRILALKSSVHFRADFAPLAQGVLVVEALGPNLADPARQPFKRLRPGVRLRPMGPAFSRG
jgi:microcystin degradation protein MlrC